MSKVEISTSPFGVLDSTGESVTYIAMKNKSSNVLLGLSTFGARVVKLELPDASGRSVDVVLGYNDLESYVEDDRYFGTTVGRVANRIKQGKFMLGDKNFQLPINNGENHLHGGPEGFNRRVWSFDVDEVAGTVVFRLKSPDGDQGYPGNLSVAVKYSFSGPRTVEIDFFAETDAPTPVSLTNHAYFNLGGHDAGREEMLKHRVQIYCAEYTPTDKGLIPTGEKRAVAGSMDLRELQDLKDILSETGFDDNFCTSCPAGPLRPYATVLHPGTGLNLKMSGTLPGVQFYTGNFLPNVRAGKSGKVYERQGAFCLEPQFFPDSVNNKLADCVLNPGQKYEHKIVWDFS